MTDIINNDDPVYIDNNNNEHSSISSPSPSFNSFNSNSQSVPNINNNSFFQIATHNVRGLSDATKQKNLLHTIELNNIDILGLSETNLAGKKAIFAFRNLENYTSYFDGDDSDNYRGQGVGLILHKSFAKHVSRVTRFSKHPGRCIYIDLHLKGQSKLRIIQTYFPANRTNQQHCVIRSDLDSYLNTLLEHSHQHDYHVILMGDFNASNADLQQRLSKNLNPTPRQQFLYDLPSHLMSDALLTLQPASDSDPAFSTFSSTVSRSRIDYIWISQSILFNLLNSGLHTTELYSSDTKCFSSNYSETVLLTTQPRRP